MRRSPVLSLALGLLLAAGSLPAQKALLDLKSKVPPGTLLYVSLPNLPQSYQDFQSMPLAKLWREQEVQEFLAQPLAFAKTQWAMALKQIQAAHEAGILPVTAKELLSLRPGSLSAALIGPGGKGEPVRFAFTLEFAQGTEVTDKLVQFGLKMLQAKIDALQAKVKDGTADPMEQIELKMMPKICRIGPAQALVGNTLAPNGGEGKGFASLTWAYYKGLLLVASSKSLAEKILSDKPGASLALDPVFHQAMAKVKSQGAEAIFFLRPKGLIQAILNFLPGASPKVRDFMEEHGEGIRKALEITGLTGCEALAAVSTYDQGKCFWDSYVLAPAPRKGFLDLAGGRTLDLDHLAWVPGKATSFSMGYLPVKKFYHTILDAVGAVDPEAGGRINTLLAAIKDKIGLDLEKDLLDQLGGEILTYGITGSSLMTPGTTVLITRVKEPQKFLNSLETLFGLTKGGLALESTKDPATGMEIWKVLFDPSALPQTGKLSLLWRFLPFIKPSFTFHKGYLVGALNPRDVKRAVLQMEGKKKGDVRSRKDVALFLKGLPPAVTRISFNDIKTTIQTVYEAASGTLNVVSLPEDIPVDLALLPGSDTVSKHFFPITSYSTETKDGIYARTVSPLGPEMVVALGAAAAGVAALVAKNEAQVGRVRIGPITQKKRPARKPKVVVLPGPKGGRPAGKAPSSATPAQKRRVQEDFDLLSSGLVIYKVETGFYPESLDILLKPTQDYPHGFLPDRTSLPKDPWGRPYKYKRTATGYRLWSVGPNGKDENGRGDDILRAR